MSDLPPIVGYMAAVEGCERLEHQARAQAQADACGRAQAGGQSR
jgi:hypothetical protein